MENTNERMQTVCKISVRWEMVSSVDSKGCGDKLWQGGACGDVVSFSQQLLAPNGTSGLGAVVQRDWVPRILT